tara:strand:- start:996 stop:2279 length:1284 start_codon:yes stop_codon:yes gene_type:complete
MREITTNIIRRGAAAAFALLCLPVLNAPGNQAEAQDFRVAAVVNDDIISTLDLGARVEMIVTSSSLPQTNEVRQRIAPQVLRTLIDEQLKLQEAKRLDITITPADIGTAVNVIEKRNRIPSGQFRQAMEAGGIPYDSVMDQIRADIAWNKIVGRRVASQITLDDVEVREATERFKSVMGKPENFYSEIFLSTSAPVDRSAVEQLAERLVNQVRGGAPFAEVARQFSQSAYASEGGEVGWVAPGDTEPEIEDALNRLEPGEIAGPLETIGGLAILRLNDRRMIGGTPSVTIDLSQAIVELPANASQPDIDKARGIASQIAAQAVTCEQFGQLGQQLGSALSGPLGKLQLQEMPQAIASVVGQLGTGQSSRPVRTDAGIAVYRVCDRTEEKNEISEDQVRDRMRLQRLQLRAERYLQDLRRAAFVEIRL